MRKICLVLEDKDFDALEKKKKAMGSSSWEKFVMEVANGKA